MLCEGKITLDFVEDNSKETGINHNLKGMN